MALKKLSSEEYLSQTGVGPMVEALLSEVLDYRPEDALTFVCDHCRDLRQKTPDIVRAFRLIRFAGDDEDRLMAHLAEVFAALTRSRGVASLPLDVLAPVLKELFYDLPEEQVDEICTIVTASIHPLPSISLQRFCSTVRAVISLTDIIAAADSLHAQLRARNGSGARADGRVNFEDLARAFPSDIGGGARPSNPSPYAEHMAPPPPPLCSRAEILTALLSKTEKDGQLRSADIAEEASEEEFRSAVLKTCLRKALAKP
uniref:Uncharacterized protein n=1 Tax=Phaeomonas parva TaxID=124430 RepID=A0A6U4FF90_9STRA|mmetsp:Transcript_25452/g.79723  ORF Transcript_25452/g.79723 Transcript_25452/m.79723 type:complete len:259 (+) Transcript_25452:139-915(+)|eukprot:CAMPEP_0118888570 /NCGR_PEP_ID=MMETSP1163-20130328/25788_1 /TAXON_ID=124430 /ORGANISM="Phaeomonas parva, Strain CCMP2877" /LENGTH=258 /DNA_ID=CAMNT_0006827141 /DNA_START=110 /DNA_END=886 /DNA_ORIENTATION=-